MTFQLSLTGGSLDCKWLSHYEGQGITFLYIEIKNSSKLI